MTLYRFNGEYIDRPIDAPFIMYFTSEIQFRRRERPGNLVFWFLDPETYPFELKNPRGLGMTKVDLSVTPYLYVGMIGGVLQGSYALPREEHPFLQKPRPGGLFSIYAKYYRKLK